jgi:hypothetical protein
MSDAPVQEHTIPAELLKPPPRTVVRRPGTLGCGTVLGRLFFIPVALFGFYLLAWVPIKAIVTFRGEVITGRIDGKEVTSGKNTTYHITYSYKIAGETNTGRRNVEYVSDFDRLAVNDPIPVHVARIFGHYFDEVLLEGEHEAKPMLDQLLLAFVPNVLLTGSLFGIVFVQYWLQKRLCRRGTPVPGRITDKKIHRSKSSTSYELHYEFAHPRLGISKSHSSVAFSQWEKASEGEFVTVLCNPRRWAHASVIYEYGNFMCV